MEQMTFAYVVAADWQPPQPRPLPTPTCTPTMGQAGHGALDAPQVCVRWGEWLK